MATSFNTDGLTPLSGARSNTVDKASRGPTVQTLPQEGQKLPQEAVKEEQEVDVEELTQAVDAMNEQIQQVHRQLQFSVDDTLDRVVITVIDRDTEEVIRTIPSEEALKFAKKMVELSEIEIIDQFV